MKQLLIALLLIAGSAYGQTSRSGCETWQYECCPQSITVTLTASQIDSLNADSLLVLTPPVNHGYRLVKPPVMRTFYQDTAFTFASGQFIMIINEFGDSHGFGGYGGGEMSTWEDPFVTPFMGINSGSFWHTYHVPFNGQVTPAISGTLDGSIYIWSTFPIVTHDPADKIVITIWYEDIPTL